jgi:hypothetical protein
LEELEELEQLAELLAEEVPLAPPIPPFPPFPPEEGVELEELEELEALSVLVGVALNTTWARYRRLVLSMVTLPDVPPVPVVSTTWTYQSPSVRLSLASQLGVSMVWLGNFWSLGNQHRSSCSLQMLKECP